MGVMRVMFSDNEEHGQRFCLTLLNSRISVVLGDHEMKVCLATY
jgi:hypothetical protein